MTPMLTALLIIVGIYLFVLLAIWLLSKTEKPGSSMPFWSMLLTLWVWPFAAVYFKIRPPKN